MDCHHISMLMTHRCSSVAARETHLLRDNTLSCISNIEKWMCSNQLKLNPAKTEFLWCTTHRRLHLIDESPFIIRNATIQPATSVRNLGVLMDRDLLLRSHIARLTVECFRALRQARAIRRSLTMDASRMLISSAVLSRIDYCNWLHFRWTAKFQSGSSSAGHECCSESHFPSPKIWPHIRRPTRPSLTPSATTHRIQTVSHGVQGPTQPRTIIPSWTV